MHDCILAFGVLTDWPLLPRLWNDDVLTEFTNSRPYGESVKWNPIVCFFEEVFGGSDCVCVCVCVCVVCVYVCVQTHGHKNM